jgi:molybdate transport system ATP-binding protein
VSLAAEVSLSLGALELEVSVAVERGETVVLAGRNGAGKTTLLRALAGLLPLRQGRVVLDDDVLEDTSIRRRLPAERRSIGFVFQDYLLFEHMSVLDNVAFGLRARRVARADARRAAHEWLERMNLESYADARPSALSGGQAQRAALARALATKPRLLLLDEPLAALDVTARVSVRHELIGQLREFEGVRLVVTHDPVEAVLLGQRVVVMEEGRVVQSGTVRELAERPRTPYVADLLGLNLWRGWTQSGDVVRLESGAELIVPTPPSGEVLVSVHPRAVALYPQRPAGSPRNVWQGTVASIETSHDLARVRVAGSIPVTALVTGPSVAELRLERGAAVWVAIKATEISVHPA